MAVGLRSPCRPDGGELSTAPVPGLGTAAALPIGSGVGTVRAARCGIRHRTRILSRQPQDRPIPETRSFPDGSL